MSETTANIKWEPQAESKYKGMIEKIPLFHREIAKTVVNKKAELNAMERKSELIEEEDIVRAFLSEVPMTFYSLMIRLMDEAGFNYRKYEK